MKSKYSQEETTIRNFGSEEEYQKVSKELEEKEKFWKENNKLYRFNFTTVVDIGENIVRQECSRYVYGTSKEGAIKSVEKNFSYLGLEVIDFREIKEDDSEFYTKER